jgi:hypothetical protein
MFTLYEQLQVANQPDRLAVAERLITEMQGPGIAANLAFWDVCQGVIAEVGAHETIEDESLPRWEFPAENSALLLVRSARRVKGFLSAIARAPQAETVIDAGCGSSALLAIGAAVTHPRAEVQAYEINGPAAHCARAVIDLFGLSDRIEVAEADVLTADLPAADLAVTETFALGLLTEKGHQITEVLAQKAREILPDHAVIYACDENPTPNTFWQRATVVDLRARNDEISGHLMSKGSGQRPISVYAAFYDARDEPILTEVGTNLTNPVLLGSVSVPRSDMRLGFSYAAGVELHDNPASLWVEP